MSKDSSDLSFLNLEWCDTEKDDTMIYPLILDPSFTDYYIEISFKLENLIKKIKNINFTYKITDNHTIRIMDINNKQPCLEIGVCDYEKVEFINTNNLKMYIVLDKQKYKRKITTRNNKIYKQNIEQSTNIVIENEYLKLRNNIYEMQINQNINFIFIENEEDLFRELKTILKFTSKDNKYIPKIKTFKVGKEQEYLEFLLSKIPGISKCVAKNVADRYKTLLNLNNAVRDGRATDLSEMLIQDLDNNKFRKLGVSQANKIIQIFTATESTEKLI